MQQMSFDIASWPTLLLHTKSKRQTMAESRPGVSQPRRVGGDGEPEVFVADEQQDLEIDLARWQHLALDVLRAEGVKGLTEMTVMFIDASTMTELNAQYMGKSYATDVLSFPLDAVEATRSPGPGAMSKTPEPSPLDVSDLPLLLGDVVICPSVAVEQAPRHAGTVDDEIALLLVHGILHVLGNDHDNPEAEAAMHARERKHLEAFHWGHAAPEQFRHIQETDQK
jgi:probable rRNA maturation factor